VICAAAPSCPYELSPQQASVPSVLIAHEWVPPALICVYVPPAINPLAVAGSGTTVPTAPSNPMSNPNTSSRCAGLHPARRGRTIKGFIPLPVLLNYSLITMYARGCSGIVAAHFGGALRTHDIINLRLGSTTREPQDASINDSQILRITKALVANTRTANRGTPECRIYLSVVFDNRRYAEHA
jgi:hypothetical protein